MAAVEITYEELLNSLEQAREDAPDEELDKIAKSRLELQIKWGVGPAAANQRIQKLAYSNQNFRRIKTTRTSPVTGKLYKCLAYYLAQDEELQ